MSSDSVNDLTETFGDFLKRHREASGKKLEDISRTTRIAKRYLEALESNDFDELPEEAFARGFVKSYAAEVGLDVDECLSRYDRFKRSLMPTEVKEIPKSRMGGALFVGGRRSTNSSRFPLVLLWGFLFLGMVLVVGLVVIYWVSLPEEELAQSQEIVEPLEPEEPSVDRIPQLEEEYETPPPPSTLEVHALETLRLQLRLDQAATQEIVLNEGESRSFEVFRQVEIRGIEVGAVEFFYNGEPIEVSDPVMRLLNRHIFADEL